MGYVLWALAPEAGEAILRDGEHWYLAAMDRSWKPLELQAPEEVLHWSLSRYVVPVDREYGARDEAVIAARYACREVWRQEKFSSKDVQRFLAERERNRKDRSQDPDSAEWEKKFPEINQVALGLDPYFQAQGCSTQESLRRILLTLQRLRESGDWRKSGRELRLTLFSLARSLYPEKKEQPAKLSAMPLSDYERKRMARIIEQLPFEPLIALTFWADSLYEEDEIAVLLQSSPEEARERIQRAAEALGRPTSELRGNVIADLCRAALRSKP